MATKWGILSTGTISNDFVSALTTLPPDQHEVAAVGARNLESAQKFAKSFSIPKAFGNYESVIKLPDIDVIYIGAIQTQHLPLAKMAMENGKNVLCEKPLAMNLRETDELISLAKRKKVFFMEAIWSRCFPAYEQLRQELEAKQIGDVYQVMVSIGQDLRVVERLRRKDMGGGSLLDLGIYCVQFAILVFKGEKPVQVLAAGHLNDEGVDVSESVTLVYSNGRMATLNVHAQVNLPCEAFVVGTKGTIKVEYPMWCPTQLTTPDKEMTFPLPETSKKFNCVNSIGLTYEAEEVRRCLKKGLTESPVMTLEETRLIAEIMDIIRKQLGVCYPQDM